MNHAQPTLIFAHRGANRQALENTRAAFDKALEYAIDGIETDVQLSRDEVAVLWHDEFLGKLGLPERRVDDFDAAQLQTAQLQTIATLASIMSLQEFLDAYRQRCRLLVEIKNFAWELRARQEIKVRQTLAMVGALTSGVHIGRQGAGSFFGGGDAGAIMVSSFDLESLIYAHRLVPGFALIYNLEPEQTFADARAALAAQPYLRGLCLPIENLQENIVNLLREQKKCIAVYTCNSDEEINRALDFAVDILITDVPQQALNMRAMKLRS